MKTLAALFVNCAQKVLSYFFRVQNDILKNPLNLLASSIKSTTELGDHFSFRLPVLKMKDTEIQVVVIGTGGLVTR